MKSDHRVSVHFSAKSLGYVAAYRYVCKSDKDVLHSADHPDLQTIGTLPISKKCIQANNKKASSRKRAISSHPSTSAKTQNEDKTKRLGYTDVTEYVLDNNIKTLKELQSIAIKCKNEGEKYLFSVLSKNGSKNVSDLIDRTWDIHRAPERKGNITDKNGKVKCFVQN